MNSGICQLFVTTQRSRQGQPTWPDTPGLRHDETDMLGALFHFTGEVERRREHKVRVRPSHLYLGVEPSDVDLRCRQGLLPRRHPFPQFRKL